MRNIYLIGFMGTGKSAVSRSLRAAYGFEAIDMDRFIEKREKMSVSDIFEKRGEEYFRNLETKFLDKMQTKRDTVIACGGGVVLREENVQKMKRNGCIVLLEASPETILERVKRNDNRPLLRGKKNIESITEMMEKRRAKYEAAADFRVHTGNNDIMEVCEEIMRKIEGQKIILASASPRRREIMEQAGLEFEIMVSHKEEVYTSTEPAEIVKELALLKAEDIAEQVEHKNVTIIGADTVVAHGGKILGKPKDDDDAFAMIDGIQGESHHVYTGVAIISYDKNGKKTVVNDAVGTKVYVHSMSRDEILAYLATGEHRDKAGSYAIQGRFAPYIEKIEGDYYNVVGLPISYIYQTLKGEE